MRKRRFNPCVDVLPDRIAPSGAVPYGYPMPPFPKPPVQFGYPTVTCAEDLPPDPMFD